MSGYALKTLVIGGGGYVGAHLVEQLVAAGRNVTVLGRSPAPRFRLATAAAYVQGDFAEPGLISMLLDTHQEIIHLAYATTPNTGLQSPLTELMQNLGPAVQLFGLVAQRQGRLVLVSSGGTVYGKPVTLPIPETHPTIPISSYGLTKLAVEQYASLYAATHGLNVVCVRPANAYGEGQRPFAGQGFIATAMASAMQRLPIKIFGACGTVRDYLHVADLAGGILRALESGRAGETYSIGSGVGLSNIEVVTAMQPLLRSMGFGCEIESFPERLSDVSANVLDSTKLREHTGWCPKVDFDTGLERTYRWLRTTGL